MATEENPFEAVRAMMLENLEKVGTVPRIFRKPSIFKSSTFRPN
jgi:hypothetical protein